MLSLLYVNIFILSYFFYISIFMFHVLEIFFQVAEFQLSQYLIKQQMQKQTPTSCAELS